MALLIRHYICVYPSKHCVFGYNKCRQVLIGHKLYRIILLFKLLRFSYQLGGGLLMWVVMGGLHAHIHISHHYHCVCCCII